MQSLQEHAVGSGSALVYKITAKLHHQLGRFEESLLQPVFGGQKICCLEAEPNNHVPTTREPKKVVDTIQHKSGSNRENLRQRSTDGHNAQYEARHTLPR